MRDITIQLRLNGSDGRPLALRFAERVVEDRESGTLHHARAKEMLDACVSELPPNANRDELINCMRRRIVKDWVSPFL